MRLLSRALIEQPPDAVGAVSAVLTAARQVSIERPQSNCGVGPVVDGPFNARVRGPQVVLSGDRQADDDAVGAAEVTHGSLEPRGQETVIGLGGHQVQPAELRASCEGPLGCCDERYRRQHLVAVVVVWTAMFHLSTLTATPGRTRPGANMLSGIAWVRTGSYAGGRDIRPRGARSVPK